MELGTVVVVVHNADAAVAWLKEEDNDDRRDKQASRRVGDVKRWAREEEEDSTRSRRLRPH